MAIGDVTPLDEETVYYIHVSVDDLPALTFTTTIGPVTGVTGQQKDAVAQRLVSLYDGHPSLTVTSAEKRVAGTHTITP
jgi:hypothetical protein